MFYKYFLYRYIRLDKNEPFYIGVGTKHKRNGIYNYKTYNSEYKRAYASHKENSIFCNIKNKTEFEVEIIYESNDYKEILSKEMEFIKIYGRKNNKTGCLANMGDGGQCNINRVRKPASDKFKKEASDRMKKKNNPNKDGKHLPFDNPLVREKCIKNMRENNPRHLFTGVNDPYARKCYQYNLDGSFVREWNSISEAERSFPGKVSIGLALIGKQQSAAKYMWKYFKKSNITPYNPKKNFYKKINNIKTIN